MTGTPVPLIGRAAELDELTAAHVSVADGDGRLILLSAEAGGGKTRLVNEFLDRLPPGTPHGVGGAVDMGDQTSPLLALRLALADLERNVGQSPVSDPSSLSTTGGQDELIADLLERFSSEAAAGTVLVIEDVHWADAVTLGVLRVVAGQLRSMPILLLITFRSDIERSHPVRAAIVELSRLAATRIDLAPLTRKDIAELYARTVGEPADQLTLDQLQARTGGNPFFTNEAIASEADGYGADSLPASVNDGLVHRLEQLPSSVLDVVRVAAIAGRISVDELAEVSAIPSEVFADAVRAASEANVLVVDGEQVFFRHALLAEAVAQTMLSFEIRAIHQRIAEGIAEGVAGSEGPETLDNLARLARHWHLAGRPQQALSAAWVAAEQAERQRFFGVVFECLQVVLDSWETVVDAPATIGRSRNDVLLAASNAAAEVGRPEESVRLARLAFEEAKVTDASRSEAAWRYTYALYAAREMTKAYRLISAEADRVIDSPPAPDVARLLVGRIGMAMSVGRYRVGVDCDERVLAMVEQLDDRRLQGWLASFRGACVATTGDVATGVGMLDQAVDLLVEAGDLGFASNARLNRLTAGLSIDHIDTLLELAEDGIELLADAPASRRLALAGTYGELLHHAGRTSEALALFQAGATRFVWRTAAERALALAALAFDTGDLAAAERLVSSGDVAAAGFNPPMALKAELLRCRLQAADDPDSAGRRLLDWMRSGSAVSVGIHGALALTYLWEWVSDESSWRDDLQEATVRILDQRSRTNRQSPAGAWLALVEAGASDGEPEQWEDAVEACRAAGMVEALGRALLGAAGAHLGQADRQSASTHLQEAAAVAEATGRPSLAVAVADLERRARLASPVDSDNAFGLTGRESEVLRLVADGLTNKEIAEQLFISPKTASVHVTNLIRKLEVSNRREAGRMARDLGLS